jgi:hypothetical protein
MTFSATGRRHRPKPLRGSSAGLVVLPCNQNDPAVVYQILEAVSGHIQGGDINGILVAHCCFDALGLKNPVDLMLDIRQF